MNNILIRINPGYQIKGEGEKLGVDYSGEGYTFWKSSGSMEVPLEVAIRLELENPKRFEIVNRKLAEKISQSNINVNPQESQKEIEELKKRILDREERHKLHINSMLDQVEKAIDLKKNEQIDLLNQLNIPVDPKGHEFDRVRKIILSGHKL